MEDFLALNVRFFREVKDFVIGLLPPNQHTMHDLILGLRMLRILPSDDDLGVALGKCVVLTSTDGTRHLLDPRIVEDQLTERF